MKAKPEYLTQRSVEGVKKAKKAGKGFVINFMGGAYLEIKEGDPPEEDLSGLSLLTVMQDTENVTLHFGRVRATANDGVEISNEVNVVAPQDDLKVFHPDYPEQEDRDLTVPPHPDERVVDGPVSPPDAA